MRIGLGSVNAAKRAAMETVAAQLFDGAEVLACEVAHGAPAQPLTRAATIEGALARARVVMRETGCEIGVGVEGGTEETEHGMLLELWAAVVDQQGRTGLGCGFSILIPDALAAAVRAGQELGPVVDERYGLKRQNHGGGLIALLTAGRLTRTQACETALLCALAAWATRDVESPSD